MIYIPSKLATFKSGQQLFSDYYVAGERFGLFARATSGRLYYGSASVKPFYKNIIFRWYIELPDYVIKYF